jgi:hypothetical protein
MERALIGLAGGAASGVLAGLLLSLFDWWGKDLRDARLRAAGLRLPSDRVFGRYHWPLAALGALQGTVLALALDVAPAWAAVSILAVPALLLPLLVLSALGTWLGALSPSRPRKEFDPGILVGMDAEEATKIARKNGWHPDLVEEPAVRMGEFRPEPAYRKAVFAPSLRIGIRDGKVVRVDIGGD